MAEIVAGVIIVALTCAIALVRNFYEDKLSIEKRKISFKESMDLLSLPVITFTAGENKLNFLLDTGSDKSYIAKGFVPLLGKVATQECMMDIVGCGGTSCSSIKCDAVLNYKEYTFNESLIVNPGLDSAFADIKEDSGVQIHGILGSRFLSIHNYILDFAELIAYQKKCVKK